jgi:hypothetical protein
MPGLFQSGAENPVVKATPNRRKMLYATPEVRAEPPNDVAMQSLHITMYVTVCMGSVSVRDGGASAVVI